jgi:hypothetical protein
MIAWVVCLAAFLIIVSLIAWWSDRVHTRQLAEHNERMRKLYEDHR